MKTSEHPAAKPPMRPRAPESEVMPSDTDQPGRNEVFESPPPSLGGGERPHSVHEIGHFESDNQLPIVAATDNVPQPTREPIGTAPQDNAVVILAYWGPDDLHGRMVRWRHGRHFNNRRWVISGGWQPADGMIPLPMEAPTEWLKPPAPPVDEIEEADEETAASIVETEAAA